MRTSSIVLAVLLRINLMTVHKIIKCSECGDIITQCRCKMINKEVEFDICTECEKKDKGSGE